MDAELIAACSPREQPCPNNRGRRWTALILLRIRRSRARRVPELRSLSRRPRSLMGNVAADRGSANPRVVGVQRHRAPEQMVRGFAKRPSGASIRS